MTDYLFISRLIIYSHFIGPEAPTPRKTAHSLSVECLIAFSFGLFGVKSEFHLTTTPLRESLQPGQLRLIGLGMAPSYLFTLDSTACVLDDLTLLGA